MHTIQRNLMICFITWLWQIDVAYLQNILTGLVERLKDGDHVIVAEGYLFEFERRGYLKAGAFVPEVVLEHPDLVRVMHEEFVHAGSDVVEAFTVREYS